MAVLPEAEDIDALKVEAKDLRIDTFCSSGPGGQSVNTNLLRVLSRTFRPNTVVSCQDEKSQIKNREKGSRVLQGESAMKWSSRSGRRLWPKSTAAMVGSGRSR